MSKSHLLLTKAFVFDSRRDIEDPKDSNYDELLGAWLCSDSAEYLVLSRDPDRPKPTTKKCDMETGEDLKSA